jgi:protein-S-isoprenylcysteine O-methyltransferase Ste14
MHHEGSAYGLWRIVLIESAFFIVFAFSFTRPKTSRDWRSLGAFSAFIVALFTEMYGFPLTIFLLSGWLARHYPGVDFMSHESGHLLHTLLRLKGNPHMDPLHILSEVLIVAGLFLFSQFMAGALRSAKVGHPCDDRALFIYPASAVCGLHRNHVRISPSMADDSTLVMFPVLLWVYVRLAKAEEKEARVEFGIAYIDYAREVPAFIPRLGTRSEEPIFGPQ